MSKASWDLFYTHQHTPTCPLLFVILRIVCRRLSPLIGWWVVADQPVTVDVAFVAAVCGVLMVDSQQGAFHQLIFECVNKLLCLGKNEGRGRKKWRLYVACEQDVLFMCLCLPHLLNQAVQDLQQPAGVQLQRDGQQLLSEPEDQRLQLGNAGEQLLRSGAFILGVRDGAGERGIKCTVNKSEYKTVRTAINYKVLFKRTVLLVLYVIPNFLQIMYISHHSQPFCKLCWCVLD